MAVIERSAVRAPDALLVRILVAAQAIFWGGYFSVLAKLGIAGIRYGGFGFAPFGNDPHMYDPKDVLGWGIPEYIIHLPQVLIVLTGALATAPLLIAGGSTLYGLWRLKGPHPRLLAASTAMTALCLVIQVTPFHSTLLTWMMD